MHVDTARLPDEPVSAGRVVTVADPDQEFSTFVRARSGALLRTAYLLTGDRHLAEDLVQDALARTHRAARRLTDEGRTVGQHP